MSNAWLSEVKKSRREAAELRQKAYNAKPLADKLTHCGTKERVKLLAKAELSKTKTAKSSTVKK